MRIMIYSHDAYGLGNIRRMLAICEYLLAEFSNLSILLVSGSPMLHSFRLPLGLDYIKVPCLNRGLFGNLSSKYLGADTEEIVNLRSQLILSAATSFRPDLLMVDKRPYGINNELAPTLKFLGDNLPDTKRILLLRDILDSSERTIAEWLKNDYYNAIYHEYDLALVVGSPEVFNLAKEYQFPLSIASKVRFCGYIHKQPSDRSREEMRAILGIEASDRLVLVTPGGGEDGYNLIDAYLSGLQQTPQLNCHSIIICGPEMPMPQQVELRYKADMLPNVKVLEFTDHLMDYMNAADVAVSMAGYNTSCEILSLNKRAVIVPRSKPSEEQLIRAERLAKQGFVTMVHPDCLTPQYLMSKVSQELSWSENPICKSGTLDMSALPRINNYVSSLLGNRLSSFDSPDRVSLAPLISL